MTTMTNVEWIKEECGNFATGHGTAFFRAVVDDFKIIVGDSVRTNHKTGLTKHAFSWSVHHKDYYNVGTYTKSNWPKNVNEAKDQALAVIPKLKKDLVDMFSRF